MWKIRCREGIDFARLCRRFHGNIAWRFGLRVLYVNGVRLWSSDVDLVLEGRWEGIRD